MAWWGKIIGGAVGSLLGPLGTLIGVTLGHFLDTAIEQEAKRLSPEQQAKLQSVFFEATFGIMGHIAKSDGRVSEAEIRAAREIMDNFGLSEAQKLAAMRFFNIGKETDYNLNQVLDELKEVCHTNRRLLQLFIEIQFQAAYADGALFESKFALLFSMGIRLGFSEFQLQHIAARIRAEREFAAWVAGMAGGFTSGAGSYQQGPRAAYRQPTPGPDPYAVLGIDKAASDGEVKRAYRKLMSQHHPDKLMSRGLSPEMMKMATAKTQEIKAAYETICRWRGMR